jgi:hypothetical protein
VSEILGAGFSPLASDGAQTASESQIAGASPCSIDRRSIATREIWDRESDYLERLLAEYERVERRGKEVWLWSSKR